jgi:hypothetical protein
VLKDYSEDTLQKAREQVKELCEAFPLYKELKDEICV